MSRQDQKTPDYLQRRLDLVAAISTLTATGHKLIQQVSGAEMEIMRLEMALSEAPENPDLSHALREVQEGAEALRAEQSENAAAIEAAEAALRDIDLVFATSKGGRP